MSDQTNRAAARRWGVPVVVAGMVIVMLLVVVLLQRGTTQDAGPQQTGSSVAQDAPPTEAADPSQTGPA